MLCRCAPTACLICLGNMGLTWFHDIGRSHCCGCKSEAAHYRRRAMVKNRNATVCQLYTCVHQFNLELRPNVPRSIDPVSRAPHEISALPIWKQIVILEALNVGHIGHKIELCKRRRHL